MKVLILAAAFLCIVGLGFWTMCQIDRFAAGGGFRPYWDEEDEACKIRRDGGEDRR